MNKIQSMTGFAQVCAAAGLLTLKSHNHRFLELHLSLPGPWGSMEHELRGLLGRTIHRGKVYFSVVPRADDPAFRPRLNSAWLRDLHAQWSALFPHSKELPGALMPPEAVFLPPDIPDEAWKNILLEGTHAVLDAFLLSRTEEGEKILPSMLAALKEIRDILGGFGPRLEATRGAMTARLRGQLAQLLDEAKSDPARIEQEAAILCARMDPEEEVVRAMQFVDRLEAHLTAPPAPAGKMLDFLIQELARELQTLSQKLREFSLREQTVHLKMLCERLREQVQNIE